MIRTSAPLAFQGIGKSFPGVKALQDISFSCKQGQIHALMGENGAGKSTLLKILSGSYTPTEGTLILQGKPVAFSNTTEALQAGIAIIYQELHLVPELTVAENIFLGQLPGQGGLLNKKLLRQKAQQQLSALGMTIDPETPLKYLSLGQWQMVEIAKALARDAQVIAFDEPTSSLSARETEHLFRVLRQLRAQGKVVLYVSHRMEEIFALSDAVTVFKDGRYVCTFDDMTRLSHQQLVQAMVGRDIGDIYGYQPRPVGETRLRLDKFHTTGVKQPVSLQVRSGEIVGLFGLVGAGRTELLKGLFGASKILSGEVWLEGAKLRLSQPIDAIRSGILLCPEDRKADGIIPVHSVNENINISARREHLSAGWLVDNHWELENAGQHIRGLKIKTPTGEQQIARLSGGNQQKAILGRWLSESHIKVMLLDEPTRGIDVGAKHEIYQLIYQLASQGVAVLFASSDLPEVLGLADRILVMREGAIAGELSHDQASESQALSLAMPVASGQPAVA
ncbi:L-arabinose transporter ATP-binding protein [Tatumella morbirosei]|uniref:L-arabinose transporter ATP-binding protein n=1 Tax=Tatumella morbirosei TaxID=642227 RepID=A0A095V6A8_9GAMM|nr:L-arabinose ABC transporter ATP-binding protein AraG [Tatumella morbirosei]KGD70340.1 L-arabinose transporter ATP-binding protein [Tatumella morbirosei]